MSDPVISLIVAMGANREIGLDNKLLWHIKDDLRLFMKTTSQHVVIHGRKSFESIGKPLKNRTNIIITRDITYKHSGCFVYNSIVAAMQAAKRLEQKGEVFILGGAEIYEQSLHLVQRMYISHVEGQFPNADAYFPNPGFENWILRSEQSFEKNSENQYGFVFRVYDRK